MRWSVIRELQVEDSARSCARLCRCRYGLSHYTMLARELMFRNESRNQTVILAQKSNHVRYQELLSGEAANHQGVFDSNGSEL